jgi:hypothetical protein
VFQHFSATEPLYHRLKELSKRRARFVSLQRARVCEGILLPETIACQQVTSAANHVIVVFAVYTVAAVGFGWCRTPESISKAMVEKPEKSRI